MNLLAIVNGASAGGKTGKRWPQIADALKAAGVDYDAVFTEGPGHATQLVLDAIDTGRDAIASCGGDGTLSEVVNGLIDPSGEPRAPEIRLALLPSGTGGDFRKTLEIEPDPAQAAQRIADGNTVQIDAGLIEFADGSPSRRFVNIASCGVGHEVDRRINELRFKPGKLAYALVSAWSIITYPPRPARVTVDGTQVEGTFSSISLANGNYFGGGMKIAPLANPTDGLLDVILSSTSRARSILGAKHLYAGTHLSQPGSTMLRGRVIEIEPMTDDRMGFDIDGEALGLAPATITALPGVLEVFC